MLSLYKFLKFVFRYAVPSELRYPLVRGIARLIIFFNGRRRSVIAGNLAPLVGPEKARQLAPVLMGNFLMTAVDFFCVRPEQPRTIAFEGWSHIEEAYGENRRVMIVTAHLGN